jgi:hypothetical protein
VPLQPLLPFNPSVSHVNSATKFTRLGSWTDTVGLVIRSLTSFSDSSGLTDIQQLSQFNFAIIQSVGHVECQFRSQLQSVESII